MSRVKQDYLTKDSFLRILVSICHNWFRIQWMVANYYFQRIKMCRKRCMVASIMKAIIYLMSRSLWDVRYQPLISTVGSLLCSYYFFINKMFSSTECCWFGIASLPVGISTLNNSSTYANSWIISRVYCFSGIILRFIEVHNPLHSNSDGATSFIKQITLNLHLEEKQK